MRTTVIQSARNMFLVRNASIAYSEQVGTNLQVGGKSGETYLW